MTSLKMLISLWMAGMVVVVVIILRGNFTEQHAASAYRRDHQFANRAATAVRRQWRIVLKQDQVIVSLNQWLRIVSTPNAGDYRWLRKLCASYSKNHATAGTFHFFNHSNTPTYQP